MSDGGLPFLPYGRQSLGDEEIQAVTEVLRSDWLTQGPRIEAFEKKLCEVTGAEHAAVVSSGTAALHLACLALGIGEGDCALTTPVTFAATSNAVLYAGGRPAFADIDPDCWTLGVDALERQLDSSSLPASLPASFSGRVKAIMPVHFGGSPAHLLKLREVARARGLLVIEDACHALGSEWQDEQGVWQTMGSGSGADVSILSFHPVKHVATGEGGAVLTSNRLLADTIRRLRHHGIERDPDRLERYPGSWYHEMQQLGFNYRITDIQCALGLVQLDRLKGFVQKRQQIARWYQQALAGDPRVRLQEVPAQVRSSWHLFVVRIPQRDVVFERMREKGIGVQVHYIPVYQHPYYRSLGYAQNCCPEAEAYADQALSLPMYPGLTPEDVDRVVSGLIGSLDACGA